MSARTLYPLPSTPYPLPPTPYPLPSTPYPLPSTPYSRPSKLILVPSLDSLALAAEIFTALLTLAGIAYSLMALWAARRFAHSAPPPQPAPATLPISILKPLKGVDARPPSPTLPPRRHVPRPGAIAAPVGTAGRKVSTR